MEVLQTGQQIRERDTGASSSRLSDDIEPVWDTEGRDLPIAIASPTPLPKLQLGVVLYMGISEQVAAKVFVPFIYEVKRDKNCSSSLCSPAFHSLYETSVLHMATTMILGTMLD